MKKIYPDAAAALDGFGAEGHGMAAFHGVLR